MATMAASAAEMSMLRMLEPAILRNPFPFYARLREHEPVHWDPYLHTWVVTTYAESVAVLGRYSASRTPAPEVLEALDLSALAPYAAMMLKQMMFMDGSMHTRLRSLCSVAFTPRRVEALKERMQAIADDLLDGCAAQGGMDVVADFAEPFPAMVMAALLGIPAEDHARLKTLSASFGELMGNFDHEPERLRASIASLRELETYFETEVEEQRSRPREGLIGTLLTAEVEGKRLSAEETIANLILMLVGGFEETANLIAGGMYALLCHPDALADLRDEEEISQTAVEELLRYVSPTQHTGRVALEDVALGGMSIRSGDAVMVVLAAANRDPLRFCEPDRLDLRRRDNRHLAFGWGSHYCFGSSLARMSAQIAFRSLRRLRGLELVTARPEWRANIALRGLTKLEVIFDADATIR